MPIYKNKNNNSWFIKVYVKDKYGKSKQITRRNKKWIGREGKELAKLEEAKIIEEYEKPFDEEIKETQPIIATFKQIFIENLRYKQSKGKICKSTRKISLRRVELHVFPELGNKNIHDITIADYEALQKKLIKKKSTRTVNSIHYDMTSAFDYAMTYYNLKENIIKKVGPIYENKDDINNFATLEAMKKIDKEESISFEEWKNFVSVLEEEIKKSDDEEEKLKNVKNLLFFICEYVLMMRVGEVQGLAFDKLYFEEKFIFLNQAYSKDAKEITPLKNRKVRLVYLTDNILNMFKYVKSKAQENKEYKDSDLIFGYKKYFCRSNIDRRRQKIVNMSNINKNVTNHKLRHSGISGMLYKRQDPTAIATMAGHNKEMTFNVYNQVLSEANKNLVQQLDNLYVPNI